MAVRRALFANNGVLTEVANANSINGLVIGTNVQAFSTNLAALAGLTAAANKLPYFTGATTAGVADLSAFAITILDDADGAAVRTTIGAQALDATLTALAAYNTNGILTQTAADTFVGRTLTGTTAEITVTNGNGVSGAPTFSLPTALTFTGKTVTGGTFNSVTINATVLQIGGVTLREVIGSTRTYYVRGDGSDSNTGLVNSAGGAFLTLQKAVDVATLLDFNGNNVNIIIGVASTFTTGLSIGGNWAGRGTLTIKGLNSTATDYKINSSSNCIRVNGVLSNFLVIQDIELSASAGNNIAINYPCNIEFSNIRFGTAGGSAHISVGAVGVTMTATGDYAVFGAGSQHVLMTHPGSVLDIHGRTITITNTPAFTQWCRIAGAKFRHDSNTFSGSATGSRYSVTENAILQIGGATLPGDSAGSTATGGQVT